MYNIAVNTQVCASMKSQVLAPQEERTGYNNQQ